MSAGFKLLFFSDRMRIYIARKPFSDVRTWQSTAEQNPLGGSDVNTRRLENVTGKRTARTLREGWTAGATHGTSNYLPVARPFVTGSERGITASSAVSHVIRPDGVCYMKVNTG